MSVRLQIALRSQQFCFVAGGDHDACTLAPDSRAISNPNPREAGDHTTPVRWSRREASQLTSHSVAPRINPLTANADCLLSWLPRSS
jgi:hypothetical protein